MFGPRDRLNLLPMRPIVVALAIVAALPAAAAEQLVACPPFPDTEAAPPSPRDDPHSLTRLAEINAEVSKPYDVLFLGDSITERWAPEIWQRDFGSLAVVNA